jgi:hypothetical protein
MQYDCTGLQWFHCLKYFMSSLSISARRIRKSYPDLSITYNFFLTKIFTFTNVTKISQEKCSCWVTVQPFHVICILFSPLLLIFFILFINYTIVYCIILLCIYEYHYALYFTTTFSLLCTNSLRDTKKLTSFFNSAWSNYRKSFIKTKTTFEKLTFADLCYLSCY